MKRIPLYLIACLLMSGVVSAIVKSGRQADEEATQREYDRSYDVLYPRTTDGPTLQEQLDRELQKGVPPAGSEFKIYRAGMSISFESPDEARLSKEARLARVLGRELKKADLVVRGRVESSEAKITRDERWVFTINRIRVSRVLAQTAASKVGDTVTVIRGGGTVTIGGYRVCVTDEDDLPLSASDGEVILFLKEVPNSAAYFTATPDDTYVVRNGLVRKLDKHVSAESDTLTVDEVERVLETEIRNIREEK